MNQPTSEQMQFNAAMRFYEAQCANLTTAGAQMAVQCEVLAQENLRLKAEIEELKKKIPPEQ